MLSGQHEVSIREVQEPQVVAADDVKVKIIYTSIYSDETAMFTHYRGPLPVGHEFSGIITELGKEAKRIGYAVGDRVTGYTW